MTPDQSALGILFPGNSLIYSTFGMTHASGVIHGLTLEQILGITEDSPSPDGKILGAASHGYKRNITLDLLATAAAPAVKSVLAITGAPDHASGYRVTGADKMYEMEKGVMYKVTAAWIPAFDA